MNYQDQTQKSRKALFTLLKASIAILTTLLLACSSGHTQQTQKEQRIPVKVATAIEKDVPVQINTIGHVEAFSSVSVKSQVAGELAHVYFKEGQMVKNGELMFVIDPRPFEAALKQAEANLARDIAQMKKAEVDARRYTDLLKKGIVSKQEYDQFITNLEVLRSTVKADRAAVENAKLQLEYCYIRSPITGRIGELLVDQGNVVKDKDTVLAVINQTKPIYVKFSVPEQELPSIRKYMAIGDLKVEARVPSDESHKATGHLSFINNEVDSETGTITLKAVFPNEDEYLWPGQFVDVTLTLTTQPNAVVVPSQSIQTGQEGYHVFIVKPDLTVEPRPVVLGASTNHNETVIVKGIHPGEKVVVEGQLQLAPGIKVEITNSPEGDIQSRSNSPGNREEHTH
ncbi:Multidrug resistance protein MdtA [bacterium HR37]|nr:Multidrug resistance protein MdtA [bacterium HR37]